MRSLVVTGLLVACSAPPKPPAPEPAAPAPKRDLAVAEPPPKPPPAEEPDGSTWIVRGTRVRPNNFDAPLRRRTIEAPQEIDIGEHELWSPCVRDFVQARGEEARRALTSLFARYGTICNAERQVVLVRPSDYDQRSYIAFRGTLAADLALDIVVCGTTAAIESIALVSDRKRWTARTTSEEEAGCMVASLPDVKSLRRALRDALDARLAIVEIDGDHDIVITDEMKRDVRLMLDALDALSAR